MPTIVKILLTCAKQRIALEGQNQDKINFARIATHNEGNCIAILRLLAKSNADNHEHLLYGPKNAKYVSKTVQNEILDIAAGQICEFLPARTSEQGNVIGSVHIYMCVPKKIVIERTRNLIYLNFVATDFFPKIISPSAGENSGDFA